MPKKSTTEEFIRKAILKCNNKFDYSLVNYINNSTKIKIICPIHGVFLQVPMSHLVKKECPKCSRENYANNKKLTIENFIKKVNKIHNNKYDYSLVEKEQGSHDKIKIICPIHGIFEQLKTSHIQGHGCSKCSFEKNSKLLKMSLSEFIKRAEIIHNNKYDYSLVNYITANIKVNIICNNCKNIFAQTPSCHIGVKHGCRKCSYINNTYRKSDWIKKAKEREGIFYIIKCWNENEEFFKLGITSNSVKKRYIHKSFMPYNYEVIREIKSFDLNYIWDLEKRFKRFKKKNHYKPLIHFAGDAYECFK